MSAKDVLYVPILMENLMSVKKLTKAGVEVLFNDKLVTLKGETIATASARKSLRFGNGDPTGQSDFG